MRAYRLIKNGIPSSGWRGTTSSNLYQSQHLYMTAEAVIRFRKTTSERRSDTSESLQNIAGRSHAIWACGESHLTIKKQQNSTGALRTMKMHGDV